MHLIYPKESSNKEKIGNSFYINKEKLVKLKPDYILCADNNLSYSPFIKQMGISVLYFDMNSVNSIYNAVLTIGNMTGKTKKAQLIVKNMDNKIKEFKTIKQKRILYLIQTKPFITIGNKSFLSDVIKKSGNISVTDNLNSSYPVVSYEYILKSKPDIIIVNYASDNKILKQFFPKSKIIYLNDKQRDFINRPGTRIVNAVEFFAKL